jgi:hypothetical protein
MLYSLLLLSSFLHGKYPIPLPTYPLKGEVFINLLPLRRTILITFSFRGRGP